MIIISIIRIIAALRLTYVHDTNRIERMRNMMRYCSIIITIIIHYIDGNRT
jgi:hypothetical protein